MFKKSTSNSAELIRQPTRGQMLVALVSLSIVLWLLHTVARWSLEAALPTVAHHNGWLSSLQLLQVWLSW